MRIRGKHGLKWISLLLAAVLLAGLMPPAAASAEAGSRDEGLRQQNSCSTDAAPMLYAESGSDTQAPIIHINPLYQDVLTEADIQAAAKEAADPTEKPSVPAPEGGVFYRPKRYLSGGFPSLEEAGVYLREQMKKRERLIVLTLNQQFDARTIYQDLLNVAFRHTGVPTEGDYIQWHYGGCRIDPVVSPTGLTMTFSVFYYTDAAQEAEMDQAVSTLLSELGADKLSGEMLVRRIYAWICDHVRYDLANLDDSEYTLKYSAYAALVNRCAICQGYASLLYRLLLECGVDCRVITGTAPGGAHAWNIIRVGEVYYEADSTRDAGMEEKTHYLKCPADFQYYEANEEYQTETFRAAYPIAEQGFPAWKELPQDRDGVPVRFADVPGNASYLNALSWACGNGIVRGTTKDTFSPSETCKRYQFVVMLYKLAGRPAVDDARMPFEDVKRTDSYYNAVLWAAQQGITAGTGKGRFSPNLPITRAQAVQMLYKAAGRPEIGGQENPFQDVSTSSSCYKAVMWAKKKGITAGTAPTAFSPGEFCKRYQAAVFLYKYDRCSQK